MKLRKHKLAEIPTTRSENGVAFCPRCGEGVTDYFQIGEFVLVEPTAGRPFFAQIINVVNDVGSPVAIVKLSAVETTKVPLATIRKVL